MKKSGVILLCILSLVVRNQCEPQSNTDVGEAVQFRVGRNEPDEGFFDLMNVIGGVFRTGIFLVSRRWLGNLFVSFVNQLSFKYFRR